MLPLPDFNGAPTHDRARANLVLGLIQLLHRIETQTGGAGLGAAATTAVRQRQSVPVTDRLHAPPECARNQDVPRRHHHMVARCDQAARVTVQGVLQARFEAA